MFNVLIDTCVWLRFAEDHKFTPLLQAVGDAILKKRMRLIVPKQVIDEFNLRRESVLKTAQRSFKGHLSEVKNAINKVGGDHKKTKMVIDHLNDVGYKLPLIGQPVDATLREVERLLLTADIIEPNELIMVNAAKRALHRNAPCHIESKNSIADAIILETYFDAARSKRKGERFAFVTVNHKDFSASNHNNLPHPDFAASFSKIRSMYFTNLADLLRKVDISSLIESLWIDDEMQPRGITELWSERDLLVNQIWYNRHKNHEWLIKQGKVQVVTKAQWDELLAQNMRNHSK